MANNFVRIAPDSTGKKIQTFENTISANIVQAQGVVLVNSAGTAIDILSANPTGTESGLIVRNIPSGTQPISGTITANQGGTWTVQPGNTANTTPWLATINQGGNSAFVTVSNALKVDGSAVTQPVSGTVTANAGTGTFTTDPIDRVARKLGQAFLRNPGDTANMGDLTTPIRIDPTGSTTQPVSQIGTWTVNQGGAWTVQQGTPPWSVSQSGLWNINNINGTVSLPTGAATEATLNKLPLSQGSVTTGQFGPLVQGAVSTNAPSYSNAQTSPLSLTLAGALRIDGTIAGDAAHNTIDTISLNPVKIGHVGRTTLPTAVGNNTRANSISDRYGRALVGHIDPGMQTWKGVSFTTAQTGTAIWTPTAGNRIAVTHLNITTGGTTAARVTIWFGSDIDTTYTEGTDQVVFDGEFAPSATSRPTDILDFSNTVYSDTTNNILRITTDAAITVRIQVYGYEFTP